MGRITDGMKISTCPDQYAACEELPVQLEPETSIEGCWRRGGEEWLAVRTVRASLLIAYFLPAPSI